MRYTKGTDLSPQLQREALRCYVNRWTVENEPRLRAAWGDRCPTIDPVTDKQWLAEHAFPTRRDGGFDRRAKHCVPAFMAS